jgi:hypothetical protein
MGMIALSVETTLATSGAMTPGGGVARGRVCGKRLLLGMGRSGGAGAVRVNASAPASSFIAVLAMAESPAAPVAKASSFTITEGGACLSSAAGATFSADIAD